MYVVEILVNTYGKLKRSALWTVEMGKKVQHIQGFKKLALEIFCEH